MVRRVWEGTKWYLNPENYRKELYESRREVVQLLAGAGKTMMEFAGLSMLDDACDGIFDTAHINVDAEATGHSCQVLPLEDTFKVIDLTGERFLLAHCACRRYFGQDDYYSCLFFEPMVDQGLRERPWETDSKVLNKEEAKKLVSRMDKDGCVHCLYNLGVDVNGMPL